MYSYIFDYMKTKNITKSVVTVKKWDVFKSIVNFLFFLFQTGKNIYFCEFEFAIVVKN